MTEWKTRILDAAFPGSEWLPFPPEAIVQIKTASGDSCIAPARKLWWGYDEKLGWAIGAVITRARRLDKPKVTA